MIKQMTISILLVLTTSLGLADDDKDLDKQEQQLAEVKNDSQLVSTLKDKYGLSDEQVKSLQDKGLPAPQMIMVSALSKESGKPIDDVLKMRTEEKMGWGKIAKELGVKPGTIGQSVASFHHERQELKEKRSELHEKKQEHKRENRMEKQAEKREHREERRADRAEKRKGKAN